MFLTPIANEPLEGKSTHYCGLHAIEVAVQMKYSVIVMLLMGGNLQRECGVRRSVSSEMFKPNRG